MAYLGGACVEICEVVCRIGCCVFFFKQKRAYEVSACLVGSEMCIGVRCCCCWCVCGGVCLCVVVVVVVVVGVVAVVCCCCCCCWCCCCCCLSLICI